MKILIVDDDPGFLNAVKMMLEQNRHAVDCASSAPAGIEALKAAEYDVVLVDYHMPDQDGIWFMQNAKLPRRTRAILTTSFVNRAVINEMFKLGISGYLIKPFDEKELIRHLDFRAPPATPETAG